MFYAGLLAQRPRSAQSLRQLLMDYFGVPVAIQEFAGAWSPLSPVDMCHLGESTGISAQLGLGAVVGDEVWYLQSRVRIVLGPLTLKQYLDFLPGGSAHEPLRAVTRLVGEQELDFEVQLILKREETPACILGEEKEGAALLGWLSWAKSAPLNRDPADTILRL
jgi:type VI secretion system protein ImpH